MFSSSFLSFLSMWSRLSGCYKLLYLTRRCYSVPSVTKYHHKNLNRNLIPSRPFSTKELTHVEFERICNETLESLSEFFDSLVESKQELKGADVTYSDGVLTVVLGNLGTYVINRQTPNKQIWLSSPNSGPKRYDYDPDRKTWIYKHDDMPLHTMLKHELSSMLNDNVDLSQCTFSEKNL